MSVFLISCSLTSPCIDAWLFLHSHTEWNCSWTKLLTTRTVDFPEDLGHGFKRHTAVEVIWTVSLNLQYSLIIVIHPQELKNKFGKEVNNWMIPITRPTREKCLVWSHMTGMQIQLLHQWILNWDVTCVSLITCKRSCSALVCQKAKSTQQHIA